MSDGTQKLISNERLAIKPPLTAVILFCISFLLVLMTAWGPTLEHIGDPFWAPHQEFHAFREIFMATFFGTTGLYSAWVLYVIFLGIGTVAGLFVGLPITGIGKSGIEPFINHGLQELTLLIGYFVYRIILHK